MTALLSLSLALPYILNENLDARVVASVGLMLMLLLSAVLFFAGLPLAATLFTYAALISACVAASFMIKLKAPFSGDTRSQIYSGILCLIVIIFTIIYRLPTKIRNKVKNILLKAKAEEQIQEKNKVKEQTTYQLYRQQERGRRIHLKPYALIFQSPLKKKVRIISGLSSFLIGFVGVIYYEEEALFHSSNPSIFLGLTISIPLLVFGFVLIIYGIKRALIITTSIAVLSVVGYWVGFKLSDLLKRSILGFVVLLIIILMFVIRVCFDLYKVYRKKTAFVGFSAYEKNDALAVVNLALFNMLPVKDYYKVAKCKLAFEPEKGAFLISEIIALITSWSNKKSYIFCGYIADPPNPEEFTLTLYFYTKGDFSAFSTFYKRKLLKMHCKNFTFECNDDPDWSIYKEILYPDTYSLNTIKNSNVTNFLESKKHDFNNPISIVYTLAFEEEENAINCANAAKEAGYIRAYNYSNPQFVFENDLPKKYAHIVYVQNECRAGVEQLNAQTVKIMEFAGRYKGELEDFDLGELGETPAESVGEA